MKINAALFILLGSLLIMTIISFQSANHELVSVKAELSTAISYNDEAFSEGGYEACIVVTSWWFKDKFRLPENYSFSNSELNMLHESCEVIRLEQGGKPVGELIG